MRLEGFLRNYQHTVATTTMLLRQRDGLIGECPTSKAKESQALEAKLVGPAQQCRTVIESALRSYAQDTSQLLTKFRDQQKKKEKLPEQAVSILNAWLHEHLCAAPQPFSPADDNTRCRSHNPYPTKAEKDQLVAQTGLEMKQINQWFINARVRVWKPAVKLMQTELAQSGGPVPPQ